MIIVMSCGCQYLDTGEEEITEEPQIWWCEQHRKENPESLQNPFTSPHWRGRL